MKALLSEGKERGELTDAEIVNLYWEREQSAITQTAAQYGNYCYSIANNILNNHEDSEECVSDTWHRAWDAIPPQRPNMLSLFLGKITRHLAYMAAGKRRRDNRYIIW